MRLSLNENDLTIGDLEDFETHAGKPINEVMKPVPVTDEFGQPVKDERGRPVLETRISARHLKVLVWIVARKDAPDFTLDDARNVRVTELSWVPASELDPKDAKR